jgi:hypothetical protein
MLAGEYRDLVAAIEKDERPIPCVVVDGVVDIAGIVRQNRPGSDAPRNVPEPANTYANA